MTATTATPTSTPAVGHAIADRMLALLRRHAVGEDAARWSEEPLRGEFSLHRGAAASDLYGMVDAIYILHTLGQLAPRTTSASRRTWAAAILACQDEAGWFTRRNLRGHSREHATAYAIGALRLLEIEDEERYVEQMRPLTGVLPMLTDAAAFDRWIRRLGFERWSDIRHKNVGWQHVWRGSHVAGGVAAAVHMTRELMPQWWPGRGDVDVDRWFAWFFDWLDERVSRRTGYWQRAWWNLLYRRPTLIDLGGAVHFHWLYVARDRPLPWPGAVVESTLSLQRETGLYRTHPFCIDLDGNFCVIRPYLQLPEAEQAALRPRVEAAIERNFDAVSGVLLRGDLEAIYTDLHGPPGALAALAECVKLPTFSRRDALPGWQHVLDRVPWL